MSKWLKIILIVITVIIIVIFSINLYVISTTKNNIITIGQIDTYDFDYIIVLGASVKDGNPSPILEERLNAGIYALKSGASDKILMSGDNSTEFYDEVNVMKEYTINEGISEEVIYLDHAGLSTYESIYRLKENYNADNILIVSQKYHLYRALYISNALGIKAVGLDATESSYSGQLLREVREIAARNKDFFLSIFKPVPNNLDENKPSN